ncbi:MAG: hypothetical protein AABZ60_18405 [Planctomycetota bacterium]
MPEKRIPKRSPGSASMKKRSREEEVEMEEVEMEEVEMEEVEMEEVRPKSKSGKSSTKPSKKEEPKEEENERPKLKTKREDRPPSKSKTGGVRPSRNQEKEEEEEAYVEEENSDEEDVEEEAPKARPQKTRSKAPSGGGGSGRKAAKKNYKNLILLVTSIVSIGLGFTLLNMKPSPTITIVSFDPGKAWKTAQSIGDGGMQAYIAWQKLRDGGGTQKQINAKGEEAKTLLNQAINQGNKSLYLQLCLLLGMDQETSESWVKKYIDLGDDLTGFEDFLDQNKQMPADKKKDLVKKWKDKTGGYQDKMTPWQEKFYDINKNTRLEKE